MFVLRKPSSVVFGVEGGGADLEESNSSRGTPESDVLLFEEVLGCDPRRNWFRVVFEDAGRDGECAGDGTGEGEGECLGEGGWGDTELALSRYCAVFLRAWLLASEPGLNDQLLAMTALPLRAAGPPVLPQLDCREVRLVWMMAVRTGWG